MHIEYSDRSKDLQRRVLTFYWLNGGQLPAHCDLRMASTKSTEKPWQNLNYANMNRNELAHCLRSCRPFCNWVGGLILVLFSH